ncbi:MAG: tetratricopeptide repeat protein [Chthonomonadales bacterium]|nr:tetratricopeptide repeat protein [Chthonomonadales bacterium]
MEKLIITAEEDVTVTFNDRALLTSCTPEGKKLFKVLLTQFESRIVSFHQLQNSVPFELRNALKELVDALFRSDGRRGPIYSLTLPYNVPEEAALLCLKKTGKSDLLLKIKRNDPSVLVDLWIPHTDAFPTNLPRELNTFIAREEERQYIHEALSRYPLVTLTGAVGCGKTRLAVKVAAEALTKYIHGVWLVELASLSDPALITQTIVVALALRAEANKTLLETLIDYLKPKRLLLLLDNCEHLLPDCAQLADTLLKNCPYLTLLATSQEPIGIRAEMICKVPPLQTPTPEELAEDPQELAKAVSVYDAPRLFVERACRRQPTFRLTNENAAYVAQICFRLDGIPLAIELAANWINVLSLEEITDRLNDRFSLLTRGNHRGLARHETLRASLDWVYNLLSEPERTLLTYLSVFVGGWTLAAAEQICTSETLEKQKVLGLLSLLVDKSLVVVKEGEKTTRFQLLGITRQYANEKLLQQGEEVSIRNRHLHYFLALAEEAASQLTGVGQLRWLDRLEAEHDNLWTALAWCAASEETVEEDLRLSNALLQFWYERGHWSEGRKHLERVLERTKDCCDPLGRAKALYGAGSLTAAQGGYKQAQIQFEESLSLCKKSNDQIGISRALLELGKVASEIGNYREAHACIRESLDLCRELQYQIGIADALNELGEIEYLQGNYAEAHIRQEECLVIRRELGNKKGIAISLNNLGKLAYAHGNYDLARSQFEESLIIQREQGNKGDMSFTLNSLGIVAFRQGDYNQARSLYQKSFNIVRELGNMHDMATSLNNLGNLAYNKGEYDSARSLFDDSLKIKLQLGDQQGIADARQNLGLVAYDQGDYHLAQSLFEESLAQMRELGDKQGISSSLHNLGLVACEQGDYISARSLLEESLMIKRALGDRRGVANCLSTLGRLAYEERDYASALSRQEESLSIRRELGDKSGIAASFSNIGTIAYEQGNYVLARSLQEESLVIYRELGDRQSIADGLNSLGNVVMELGDHRAAFSFYKESLRISRELEDRKSIIYSLKVFASLAVKEENRKRAVLLWGAAASLRDTFKLPMSPSEKEKFKLESAVTMKALGLTKFDSYWTEGEDMSWEQAVAYALEEV